MAGLRRSSSGWEVISLAAASAIRRRADLGKAARCPASSQVVQQDRVPVESVDLETHLDDIAPAEH
jgi:hypothetical protein